MDRQNQRYNLLDEINTEKGDWNIRVRVTRMWEVLNIKTNNELISVDLVLLEDNLIHASIRKSFVNHFRDIQEGKIYRIKYFGVVKNKDAYRIVNHKYMIRFYATTSVKLLESNDELIAKQKVELAPFDELKYLADKNMYNFNRREKIRITFWEKFAKANNEDICFDNSVWPIIVITSTTIKTYMRKLSLSSTNSSKLYVNLDIPEVIELRKILEEIEFSLHEKEKKIKSLQL
ncbi:replication protein A 70 kDa DNA-binding subunit C-like [Castanea sativa]|uniref:replication protein A 70 kDa DNA-binding subunit C-like n=1 Tax=Castanea sativa TaxID=21020 RepID=UPI003F651238